MFTRAGNFAIDKLGNIVTAQGLNLLGWQKYEIDNEGNYIFDTQEEIKPLNLYEDEYNMNKRLIAAQVTTKAVLSGNLDATKPPVGGYTGNEFGTALSDAINDEIRADGTAGQDGIPDDGTSNFEPHFIVPLTIYDKLGNEYKINVKFWKNFVDSDAHETSWYYTVTGAGAEFETQTAGSQAAGYIKFNSDGKIITDDPDFNVRPQIRVIPDPSVGTDEFSF